MDIGHDVVEATFQQLQQTLKDLNLAVQGALTNRCKIQNGHQGASKWLTGPTLGYWVFCQAQSKPQLQLRWTEMSLISNSNHPPTRESLFGPSQPLGFKADVSTNVKKC